MKQRASDWWQRRGKKTWYIFVPGVVFVVLVAVIASVILAQRNAELVHIHAGFHVYVDGVRQDYSPLKYMFLEPCGDVRKSDDVRHKVHLHDNIGDVAHIHAPGVTWGDLFTSVGLAYGSQPQVFLNGQPVDASQIMGTKIKDQDSAVFIYGDNASLDLSQVVATAPTPSYIEQVAAKSTGCGSETN